MNTLRPVRFALACTALFCTSLHAQVILSDSFTDADGTALANHAPDVDLPGGTYQTPSVNGQPTDTISGNTATASASSVSLLAISGNGQAAPTGDVTLSLDLKMGTIEGADPQRGIFVGFYSTFGSINPDNGDFEGILIRPNGDLYQDIQTSFTLIGTAPTGFSASNFETLTYSLNMSTGIISNINFAGTTYTPTTADVLKSGVAYVGYDSASAMQGDEGFVDNLVYENSIVIPAPEPSTWAMVLGSLGLLGGVQKLRKNRRM